MGIRGLETFMEKQSNASYQVNIKRLIRDFRNGYHCTPVVVIDGMSIMRFVYKFLNLSWLYGGQMKEYEETLKEFINNFLSEGAELVFYFDGPHCTSKNETWIRRRYDSLKDLYNIMDGLASGDSILSHENSRTMVLPSSLASVTIYTAKKCGCKVYTSIRECDLEIAEYAAKHRCMAILAQDSDFAIFNAAKFYLSMKNFNFFQMTTLNYDSFRLASFLGLSRDHLPLFATLLGNDIISSDELKDFHLRMLKRRGRQMDKWIHYPTLFIKVANFVKSFPGGFDIPRDVLNLIAHKVFAEPSKSSLIQESLQSYNLKAIQNQEASPPTSPDKNWNAVLRKFWELYRETNLPTAFYSIIILEEYWCSTCFEDYRMNDLPASQTVLKPLRQKLYGILLHEKPNASGVCKVKEMVMCSENSLDKPVFLEAVKPNVHHPGLLALWCKNAPEESWILIGDVFGIDPQKIKTLPPHLILPSLTIKYLHDRVRIEKWELRALISSVVLVRLYSVKYFSQIKPNNTIQSTRPLRLFTMVTRSYSTTSMIFEAVGNPLTKDMTVVSNFQDGKLFNVKYNEAQYINNDLELCDNKEVAVSHFGQLMEFILTNQTVEASLQ